MKLVVGKKYKWKHEKIILIYLEKNGNLHVFSKADTRKIWCEIFDSDLHLMEEVK